MMAGANDQERAVQASLMNHGQPGQQLQPCAVGSPSGSRLGGHAAVVVQVYAVGRGIALAGQVADLLQGEGAFELEAHGVSLVVNPAGAVETHRLVASVERYVLTPSQTVETVDQQELAKFGFVGGRDALQAKTAILNLPQGAGKTVLSRNMAARLGCLFIVDNWYDGLPLLRGALHLTHLPVNDLAGLMEVAA